jgi:hypothetical protein
MFMSQGMLIGFPLKDDLFRLIASRFGEKVDNAEPTLDNFQKIFDAMAPGTATLRDLV